MSNPVFAGLQLRAKGEKAIVVRLLPGQKVTRFRPGNSGSVVVFEGVPVAIITDALLNGQSEAKASRLDRILVEFAPTIGLSDRGDRIIPLKARLLKADSSDLFNVISEVFSSDDRGLKSQAVAIGLNSDNALVKSLALRHAVCSKPNLLITSDVPSGYPRPLHDWRGYLARFR